MDADGNLRKRIERERDYTISLFEKGMQNNDPKIAMIEGLRLAVSLICYYSPKIYVNTTPFSVGWESSVGRRMVRKVSYLTRDAILLANDEDIDSLMDQFFIGVQKALSLKVKEDEREFVIRLVAKCKRLVADKLEQYRCIA